jgi:hypothetical protein
MNDWKQRLTQDLEPVLRERDPRTRIGAYHDMPFAIFVYPPEAEFELREQLAMLRTRLEQRGKRVTTVSLAACLDQALEAEGLDPAALAQVERDSGLGLTIETVHAVLSEYQPLDRVVAGHVPTDAEPTRDLVFLTRAGALFPVYRTSSLLEQIKGQVSVPTVLFYPGVTEGPAGLRFMGVLDAEHNYRPKIY